MATRESSAFAVALVFAAAAMLLPVLFGQAFYGSVAGTITDQSGGVLLGATGTPTNVAISFFGRSQ